VLVPLRDDPDEVPTVDPVDRALEPRLTIERGPSAQVAFERRVGLGAIVGMQPLPERLLRDLGRPETAVLEPGLVPVGDPTAGVRRPDALGHRIEQLAVALLILAFEDRPLLLAQEPLLDLELLALKVEIDEHRRL